LKLPAVGGGKHVGAERPRDEHDPGHGDDDVDHGHDSWCRHQARVHARLTVADVIEQPFAPSLAPFREDPGGEHGHQRVG
jgi:hypothetical protein